MTDTGPIAVMDGTCALCTFGARAIHRLDNSGEIRIATVQSAMGQSLMAQHGVTVDDPETWLFVEGGTVWRDFDAMIRVGERSGGWGRVLSLLRLVPRPLRNWLYLRIARNRYALLGRADMCAVPDPAFRKRLIM